MSKILKVFLCIIFIVLCLNLFVIPAEAATRYIYDNSDILTATEEQNLKSMVTKYVDEYNGSFCLLTVDSCSMDPYQYARNFYYTHSFEDDGIIIMIYNDQMYIEAFGDFKYNLSPTQMVGLSDEGQMHVNYLGYEDAFVSVLDKFRAYYAYDNDIPTDVNKKSNWAFLQPTFLSLCISFAATAAITCFFVFYHNSSNTKINAVAYLSNEKESFKVTDRTTIFVGDRQEICRGYYRERSKR